MGVELVFIFACVLSCIGLATFCSVGPTFAHICAHCMCNVCRLVRVFLSLGDIWLHLCYRTSILLHVFGWCFKQYLLKCSDAARHGFQAAWLIVIHAHSRHLFCDQQLSSDREFVVEIDMVFQIIV